MRTLARIGDKLLSALVPETSAAACVPPDSHIECDYVANSDCYLQGLGSYLHCYYDCVGNYHCVGQGCCV